MDHIMPIEKTMMELERIHRVSSHYGYLISKDEPKTFAHAAQAIKAMLTWANELESKDPMIGSFLATEIRRRLNTGE